MTGNDSVAVQLSQLTMLTPGVTGQAGWTPPGTSAEAQTCRPPVPWYQPIR